MMTFLTIEIITLGISLVMDELFTLHVYKNYADMGYKSSSTNKSDLPNNIAYFPILANIIPIYNVLVRLFTYSKVLVNRKAIFESLKEYEVIIKMDKDELEEYSKCPTASKAINISKKGINKEGLQSIYMIIEHTENQIFYRMISEKEIEIVKVEGPINKMGLNKDALVDLIYKCWFNMLQIGYNKYGDLFKYRLMRENKFTAENINDKTGIEEFEFNYDYSELAKLTKYFESEVKGKTKVLKR